MASTADRFPTIVDSPPSEAAEPARLEAPSDLVERYLELTAERRALEDRLAYVKGELELLAAGSLNDQTPRGRFVAESGAISARLQPTCVFDRVAVAHELQRAGRLSEVAVVQGPALARYLARDPIMAARLKDMVRFRKSVVLLATQG